MSPADLNPTVAAIGVLLLIAIAALVAAAAPRQQQRVQTARTDEEGES